MFSALALALVLIQDKLTALALVLTGIKFPVLILVGHDLSILTLVLD